MCDEAVIVCFLEIFIDDTAGPNACHFRAVDGLNFAEDTGFWYDTSIFREEYWDWIIFEFCCSICVSACLKSRISTPFVDVNTVEVNTGSGRCTSKVICNGRTDISVVVGSISHRYLSVTL